jgi:hypothetical protein
LAARNPDMAGQDRIDWVATTQVHLYCEHHALLLRNNEITRVPGHRAKGVPGLLEWGGGKGNFRRIGRI